MADARGADLGRMLRAWRKRRPPQLVTGLPPFRGRRGYLTQADMAHLLGVTERWYRALESGERRGYRAEMIAGIVRVLDLSDQEADTLYRGAGHRPPPHPARTRPDPALLDLMHQQRCVSCVCDQAWDVVGANTVAARHCPWTVRPGANVMEWAFSPDGRYQLRDWERAWAPWLLGLLRTAWQHRPDDDRLTEVVESVRSRPGVDELWDAGARVRGPAHDEPRPMYFPLVAPESIAVRVAAYSRYGDPALRWLVLTPAEPGPRFT